MATIDLRNVTKAYFKGNELAKIKFNGETVWQKDPITSRGVLLCEETMSRLYTPLSEGMAEALGGDYTSVTGTKEELIFALSRIRLDSVEIVIIAVDNITEYYDTLDEIYKYGIPVIALAHTVGSRDYELEIPTAGESIELTVDTLGSAYNYIELNESRNVEFIAQSGLVSEEEASTFATLYAEELNNNGFVANIIGINFAYNEEDAQDIAYNILASGQSNHIVCIEDGEKLARGMYTAMQGAGQTIDEEFTVHAVTFNENNQRNVYRQIPMLASSLIYYSATRNETIKWITNIINGSDPGIPEPVWVNVHTVITGE